MVLLPKLTSGCLVLGLGNPFLGDDRVGHRVAESLKSRLAGLPGLAVQATSFSGIRLLEPQPYIRFMSLVSNSRLLITDSGGIQ